MFSSHPSPERTIVWQLRVPRIFTGFLVGAGLSVSGCVFQALLGNPLASPYTLGISGGAAFGASLGTVLGLSDFFGGYFISASAFLGALLSFALVFSLARRQYFLIPHLVLTGMVVSFLFSSLVLLILALSKSEEVHSIILWLMGDLSTPEVKLLKISGAVILGGIFLLTLLGRELNILTLGEEKASYLGVEVVLVRKILFFLASLITSLCVAQAGIIGFIGLVVPHIMRYFASSDHRFLIPASALGGAFFLALTDSFARSILAPVELPVGVITGLIGGVFFLSLLMKRR